MGRTFIVVSVGSPGGLLIKNLPAIQETCARSLGQEDPLKKGMATHSRIPWTEEAGELLQSMGHKETQLSVPAGLQRIR